MKKLIYKDIDIEVFKTNNITNPYILELENEEIARFDCSKDEEISLVVPVIFESLINFLEENKNLLKDLNYNFDCDLNLSVKKAFHFH